MVPDKKKKTPWRRERAGELKLTKSSLLQQWREEIRDKSRTCRAVGEAGSDRHALEEKWKMRNRHEHWREHCSRRNRMRTVPELRKNVATGLRSTKAENPRKPNRAETTDLADTKSKGGITIRTYAKSDFLIEFNTITIDPRRLLPPPSFDWKLKIIYDTLLL
jgi:hypothetical protein